jgi:hypothetical protein
MSDRVYVVVFIANPNDLFTLYRCKALKHSDVVVKQADLHRMRSAFVLAI